MLHRTPVPQDLQLTRLGSTDKAGLVTTSLPLPRGVSMDLAPAGRSTWTSSLGQWFDEPGQVPAPRRLLMAADGGECPRQKTAPENRSSDHASAQSLQYVPWVQDRLWNATVERVLT